MLLDEYPDVKVGDWIRYTKTIDDEGEEFCRRGDFGHVIDKRDGFAITTVCERTGRVYDCEPDEFEVLCDADFARTPETTPKKRMNRFVRVTPRLAKVN